MVRLQTWLSSPATAYDPANTAGLRSRRDAPRPRWWTTVGLGLAAPVIIILLAMSNSAVASEPVLLHAAGSLRSALTEVASAFEAASGQKVDAKYGPSGTLKDEIAGGMRAEVFASANM